MVHTFPRHQILSITTGRLYTKMDDIYNFFDKVIEPGIMTHSLPNAREAIVPILKRKLPANYFEDIYDVSIPNVEVSFTFEQSDKNEFFNNYGKMDSPLAKK